MLLESIRMVNFRQFLNETIEFASGENGKNVTIVLGNNGTGKTTLAQAFVWCLYGTTYFFDKTILNKKIATELTPNQEATVRVELKLIHNKTSYVVIREQNYKKDYPDKLLPSNTILNVGIRKEDGNIEYLSPSKCEDEVKKILPEELSCYFFFDGERIDRMSKEISSDRKSADFAEAVKGLLGLNSISSAIDHFNPRKKASVIGTYDSRFDTSSEAKSKEYADIIEDRNRKIDEIDAELKKLEEDKKDYTERKDSKTEELKGYEEGEKLQTEKENLEKEVNKTQELKSKSIKSVCELFNGVGQLNAFFSASLIQRAVEFLSGRDFTGKDIPYMNAQTVEYLLNQAKCICGACLDEGTDAYKNVRDLMDFLPPKSISAAIGDFKDKAKERADDLVDFESVIGDAVGVVSGQSEEIDDKQSEINDIEKKLSGDDVSEKVRRINSEIRQCAANIDECDKTMSKKLIEKAIADDERRKADTSRKELVLRNNANEKTRTYRAYALRIYNDLKNEYETREQEVRKELEESMNDIFKKIYNGGMSLSLDEKYRISVSTNDAGIETSTGQSIAVIFSFITAIIKMAKENSSADAGEDKILVSEPYPLVMDAPLSSFDTERIQTVCETLPAITEQIIIFIKDTDGDYAEKYMSDKIGKRYQLKKDATKKDGELLTTIEIE